MRQVPVNHWLNGNNHSPFKRSPLPASPVRNHWTFMNSCTMPLQSREQPHSLLLLHTFELHDQCRQFYFLLVLGQFQDIALLVTSIKRSISGVDSPTT